MRYNVGMDKALFAEIEKNTELQKIAKIAKITKVAKIETPVKWLKVK